MSVHFIIVSVMLYANILLTHCDLLFYFDSCLLLATLGIIKEELNDEK